MAAGLGFKTFSSGDILTASDVNGYLMQGVLVFASEAARDAAITSPEEGQFAYTKDNNSLWYYTGSAWAASGATGDIEGVTAGTGISGGGTSGTVTITNSMATAIDAKGDLIGGTGADTFARLAVGANDTVLTADSSTATGLKWATAATGGMTQIATGTLSGATLDISSIPGTYNYLILYLTDFRINTTGLTTYIKPNNTTIAGWYYGRNLTSSASPVGAWAGEINPTGNMSTTSGQSSINVAVYTFHNYASASTRKMIIGQINYNTDATNDHKIALYKAAYHSGSTSAITSIRLDSSSTWSAGTYTLWGVK